MERISVWLPQLDTRPSALSTAPLNNMTSTSSNFQATGYGTSSSPVSESMFDDRPIVARSYTSSMTVLAVENVDVRQSILLDISLDGIHVSQFRSSSRSHTFYLRVAMRRLNM